MTWLALAAAGDVLVLDVRATGVDIAEAKVVDGFIAQSLSDAVRALPVRSRPRLSTSSDLRTLSQLEADKAALGCEIDESCMAEIAGAMGARFVITGTLAALGSDRILQLSLVDVRRTVTLTRTTTTAKGAVELHAAMAPAVDKLVDALNVDDDNERSEEAITDDVDAGVPALGIAGAVVGGLAGAVAVASGAVALYLDSHLDARSTATVEQKRGAIAYGPAVIIVAVSSGAVAVGASALAVYGFTQGAE